VSADDSGEARIRRKQQRDRSKKASSGHSSNRERPGASSSSGADHRKNLEQRKASSGNTIEPVAAPAGGKGEEEVAVEAIAIDEEAQENEPENERENERIRALEERNRALANEMKQRVEEAEEQRATEQEERARKTKRNICIVLIFILLAGGGGIAAYFLTKKTDAPSTTPNDGKVDPMVNETVEDPISVTETPSSGPTSRSSLQYGPPTPEECERIAFGEQIDGEEMNLDVAFDVKLTDDTDVFTGLSDLKTKLDEYLLTSLIGCPRNVQQRHLGGDQRALGAKMNAVRRLDKLGYVVTRADTTLNVVGDACEDASARCYKVIASLALKLRGKETALDVKVRVGLALPTGEDIRPELLLEAPFDTIIARTIGEQLLEDTSAPSVVPSLVPSEAFGGHFCTKCCSIVGSIRSSIRSTNSNASTNSGSLSRVHPSTDPRPDGPTDFQPNIQAHS